MPSPLNDDMQVEYKDKTFASKEQMALDVVNFLQFIADPEMQQRKKMGVRTIIFLLILLIITIIAKKAIWQKVK